MSVPKLQVRLVRLIRFTMLDSLGVCLHLWIYERSQSQIQLTESDRDPPKLNKNLMYAYKRTLTQSSVRECASGGISAFAPPQYA